MLSYILPPFLRGILCFMGYLLTLVITALFVYLLGIIKYIIPLKPWHKIMNRPLSRAPMIWAMGNQFNMWLFTRTHVELIGAEKLDRQHRSLLIVNHQSWVDVVLLHRHFVYRMPMIKVFIKSQILWVPLLGLGCWLVGYPFMKRYTKDQLAKKPHLKGKDLETTRRMCRHFQDEPVTIMSFIEGTRYTPAKAKRQRTPYKHLLKPRAGGIAYTLMCMGDHLQQLVNVTIIYPDGRQNFWDYVCGKIKRVVIRVDTQPIPQDMRGDYINDREFRVKFQNWLNDLWQQKDELIDTTIKQYKDKI